MDEKPRGSGVYYLHMNHKGLVNKKGNCTGRRSERVPGKGPAAKSLAEKMAKVLRAKFARGDLGILAQKPAAPAETFATYADRWLKGHVAAYTQPATQANYGMAFRNYWLPALGTLPLTPTGLTRERVKSAVDALVGSGRIKPSTVKTLLIPLRACIISAVEAGHLTQDPTVGLSKLIAKRQGDERFDPADLFTAAELDVLITTAERDLPEHAALIVTLCRTAVRDGEALGLQVDDPDFISQPGWLWIKRTRSRGRHVSDRPKGGKTRRIEMTAQLVRALRDQHSLVRAEAALRGRDALWLFPKPGTERPMRYGYFHEYVWKRLMRCSGLRYRNPHTIRHSVASLLLQEGRSVPYVSAFLGHASATITLQTYAHALPQENRGALAVLDTLGSRASATVSNPNATAPAVRPAK